MKGFFILHILVFEVTLSFLDDRHKDCDQLIDFILQRQ